MQIVIRFNGTAWEIFSTNDIGSVIAYARNIAPIGYLKCNGAAVSRTVYARLFAIIGTTFGVGNGTTTFNLPDLRGEFIRGWADDRAVDTGRVFGSAQAQAIEAHNHSFSGHNRVGISSSAYGSNATLAANMLAGSPTTSPVSDNTGGTETRPRNVALLYCIKF
jgi:microcystin-dependent protein